MEVPFHFVSPSERGFLLYAITLATWNLAWMHDWFSWVWPKNEFCCVSSSVFFLFLVSVFCLLAHVLAWNHICICIYVWIRIDVGPHVLWRWTQPHGRSSYRTEEILICPLLHKLLHALSIVISLLIRKLASLKTYFYAVTVANQYCLNLIIWVYRSLFCANFVFDSFISKVLYCGKYYQCLFLFPMNTFFEAPCGHFFTLLFFSIFNMHVPFVWIETWQI